MRMKQNRTARFDLGRRSNEKCSIRCSRVSWLGRALFLSGRPLVRHDLLDVQTFLGSTRIPVKKRRSLPIAMTSLLYNVFTAELQRT